MASDVLDTVRAKVEAADRITNDEALFLMREANILDLAPLAQTVRRRHNPQDDVTFVVDTNLNYTNVCDAYCTFCAFYRTERDDDAYTHSVDEVMEMLGQARDKGVTTVLMQGGLNPKLPFQYYLDLVSESRRRYPDIHPHFFSAPEIMKMSEVSGLSVHDVLAQLKDAGLQTIPGGGSEILSNRVKHKISRLFPKGKVDDWTLVHSEAHKLGYKTTATMMYGHLEEDEDVVEHLDHIRRGPGRERRLHRLHSLELQEGQHRPGQTGEAGSGPQRLFTHHGCLPHLPGQLPPHPGVMVLRGQENGAGRPTFRRGRLRRHPL